MQETRGRTAAPIAAQLVAVWLLGAMGLPMGFGLVAVAVFVGSGAMLVAVLVAAALAIGYLWFVVRLTAPVSLLGATAPRRALWVLLVLGGGTAMWGAGWALTDEAGLGISHNTALTLIFGGVPFVLVAGVLLRRWYLSLTALVVLLGLVATGLVALGQSGPDELTERLDHARLSRDMAYVVEVPGYRPMDTVYGDRLGTGLFLPEDPAAIPPDHPGGGTYSVHISLVVYPVFADDFCFLAECSIESDGSTYVRRVDTHEYVIRHSEVHVHVIGGLLVDRALLREVALAARPATDEELLRALPPPPATGPLDILRRRLRG